jgi:hypothetical protein
MKFASFGVPASGRAFARAALLAAAAFAALASNAQPDPPAQYPPAYPGQQPYGSDGSGYGGGGAYGGGGYGGASPLANLAGGGQTGGAPGQDYCFTLSTPQTTTSICGVGFGACERQRQAAASDGQSTTDCVPWSPVACFQLGADPSPEARFCAANLDDCELWRRIDREKNGTTGDACAWKQ